MKFNPHFQLDPWQKEFLYTKGDKILCCGRQVGKSEICGMDAGEYAANHKNEVILMIAPTERQAFALFNKTLTYLVRNHSKLICKGKKRPTKSKIELKNGMIIWCLPVGTAGLGIRFLTVHRLYADEASQIPEPVWAAVTPMLLTTGGDSIYLSTPFGDGTEFANCFQNVENAYGSFKRFSVDSETVVKERVICETWTEKQREKALIRLAQARARMTTLEYAQEYLGKILADLRQVFPDELIRECMVLNRRFSMSRRGSERYFLGVDVARMGEDESTFEIVDRINKKCLEQVENEITTKTLTTATTERILTLNRKYNFKQIFIDDGGMGVGVFDQLLTENSTKRKVVAINNLARPLDREEKQKKKILKEDLYNNLLGLMERKEIKLLKDDEIFQSLKSVQFEIKNGRVKYHGNYTHIAEGLIRAAWCVTDKGLNIYIY